MLEASVWKILKDFTERIPKHGSVLTYFLISWTTKVWVGVQGMGWFEVYQKGVYITAWDFDRNQKCSWGILEIFGVVFCPGFGLETFQ